MAHLHHDDGLVFDVGLHKGEDTAYYLRKGYRVVAFEADPELVAHCERRFAEAIADGRLTIVHGAIAPSGERAVTFYRHSGESVWGTTDRAWVARNAHRGAHIAIEVPVVDFAAKLAELGVPHYAKIDVEGADRLCLDALTPASAPRFLSIESDKTSLKAVEEELDRLEALGYTRFCAVQQQGMERRDITTRTREGEPLVHRFEPHSSGAFGDDLEWSDRASLQARYERIFRAYRRYGDASPAGRSRAGRVLRRQLNRFGAFPGWYDTHAGR
jgi:FkbM family methyltransferase